MAQQQNSAVSSADNDIQPLFNPRTGRAYEGFPRTARDLLEMHPPAMGALLRLMGQDPKEDRVDRLIQLKRLVGLAQI
jgi:hypothetical protein